MRYAKAILCRIKPVHLGATSSLGFSMAESKRRQNKMFYLHIPKTAGQTLALRLSSAFPFGTSSINGQTLYYPLGIDELVDLMLQNNFVERHVTGPVLSNFQQLDILTTIREPVSQIVSNYLHIRRGKDNGLNKVASMLNPAEFFAKFGDLIGNGQSKYLVQAFFALSPETLDTDGLATYMLRALDRIKYVVPTERIDSFLTLWTIETGLDPLRYRTDLNRSVQDGSYAELIETVKGMPHLYCVDLLLWSLALQRFDAYKEETLRKVVSQANPSDSSCSYFKEQIGIWLTRGWHPPQYGTGVGTAWWAGPDNYSRVSYCRSPDLCLIDFSVAVWCGVGADQLLALGPSKRSPLPIRVLERSADHTRLRINIEGLPLTGDIYLWVPIVSSPSITNADSIDMDRRSFATFNWELA
jgi:hypothetical protein